MTQKSDAPAKAAYSQLRRGSWFGSLPPSMAKALLEAGRSEEYQISEVIYPEGSPAQGLFAVLEGAVHFEKFDRAGHRVLLHVAPPGFWFGEIAAGGGERTMVTARCYTRGVVWRVPLFVLSRILSSEPELFSSLSQLMAGRFSALIDAVCAMRRPTALGQIAGRLALMDEKCRDCDSAVTISVLQMSQSDLADMTGHARQTINAAVNRLEDEGLIRVGHRQIVILNSKGLDAYCTGEKS